jgi:hypothetical protein
MVVRLSFCLVWTQTEVIGRSLYWIGDSQELTDTNDFQELTDRHDSQELTDRDSQKLIDKCDT